MITLLLVIGSVAQAQNGKPVYDKFCAGCHGDTGAGDGFGSKTMLPHPRDFTKGVYKIRTTASGEIPTDDDLRHIIEVGMPGTAMPEWKSQLSASEITSVIGYIKSFSANSFKTAAKPIAIGKAPSGSGVDEGKAVFQKLECSKCHGLAGRADGKSAPTLKDDYGNPIRPADLTENWRFRGGNSVSDIYTRLRTGLDGTPMPSFQDAVENKLITDEQLWRVAQYVHSLAPEKAPEPREVVRAARAATLPSLDDAAWGTVERFWVPLVGQIVDKPRWFSPTVDGVWVQALHDGRTLALRVSWDDPTKSPNPAWDEWLGRMAKSMTDVDGPLATQQAPDRLVIHWAPNPSDESKRPYFLGGDAKSPVYAWRWTGGSEPKIEEGTETGLGKFTALPNASVTQTARYADGQWQVLFTRPLASSDTTKVPRFTTGHAIPVAFYAADGSNGEDEIRGAVSTWYMVYLDVPTPTRVFVAPVVMIALSAGLGMLLVTRAQRLQNGRSAADSTHTEER